MYSAPIRQCQGQLHCMPNIPYLAVRDAKSPSIAAFRLRLPSLIKYKAKILGRRDLARCVLRSTQNTGRGLLRLYLPTETTLHTNFQCSPILLDDSIRRNYPTVSKTQPVVATSHPYKCKNGKYGTYLVAANLSRAFVVRNSHGTKNRIGRGRFFMFVALSTTSERGNLD